MKWPGAARREAQEARQDVIDQMGDRADKRAADAKEIEEAGFATMESVAEMRKTAEPYEPPLFLRECDARHPEWPKVKVLCDFASGHGKVVADGRDGGPVHSPDTEAGHDHGSRRDGLIWDEQDVPEVHRTVFRIKIESRDLIGLSAYARLKQTEMAEETGENMQKLRVENVVPVTVSGRRQFKGEAVFETWRPGYP